MNDQTEHPVGYMCPPERTQFQKGKSGNPRGRPKKKEDIYTLFQRVLKRKVPLKGMGKSIPMSDALIHKLKELALAGDRRALDMQRYILDEAHVFDNDADDPEELKRGIIAAFEEIGVNCRPAETDVSDTT